MKKAIVTFEGVSPYSQSKYIDSARHPKLQGESSRDYEWRMWRERMHVGEDGGVFIPAMAFKNAIAEAAKFLSLQIPGKGKSTYTKHIEAGILIVQDVPLGIKADKVDGEELFVPADGVRGSGKRVAKMFPKIASWRGSFEILVVDETVLNKHDGDETVLQYMVKSAGQFIGLGRFRPRNNGTYGRFVVTSFRIEDVAV